jgi:L-fuconate dehydratase
MTTIVSVDARDIRFPTSRSLHGSDAMHPDPDYSAAYVVVRTDADDGLEGHGLTFTIGRGTEICVLAAQALAPLVVGRTLEGIESDMRGFWRGLVGDSKLGWLGAEKGVVHLAAAAVVNAVWDLWAKRNGKPLWKLLADLSPEELVSCVDFGTATTSSPRRKRWSCYARRNPAARCASCRSAKRAIPHTRPRPAGSATTTRRSRRSFATQSTRASRT